MCYIMVVKQIGSQNLDAELVIRDVLREKSKFNDDGFYLQNGSDKIRTLDERVVAPIIQEAVLDNLMVHFRIATVGIVNEENVHGWEYDDWRFFHNGSVFEYNDYLVKNPVFSDSRRFFEDLWLLISDVNSENALVSKKKSEKFNHKIEAVIQQLSQKTRFNGRAVLYNTRLDRMFLFGDFNIYLIAQSYVVISSAVLDLEEKIYKKIHGFNFNYDTVDTIGNYITSGIGVIENFSNPTFEYHYLGSLTVPYTLPKPPLPIQNNNSILPLQAPVTKSPTDEELDKQIDAYYDNEYTGISDDPYDFLDRIIEIQTDFGYIGFDANNVQLMYDEKEGLVHDINNKCCEFQTCRPLEDFMFGNGKLSFRTPDTKIYEYNH